MWLWSEGFSPLQQLVQMHDRTGGPTTLGKVGLGLRFLVWVPGSEHTKEQRLMASSLAWITWRSPDLGGVQPLLKPQFPLHHFSPPSTPG